MFDAGPGESQLSPFLFGRGAAGYGLARRPVKTGAVPLLHQEATRHRADVIVEQTLVRRLGREDDHVLAPRKDIPCFIEDFGRDHDVRDDLHDLLGGRAVERPVDRNDPAEGRDLVAFKGHPIRRGRVLRDREPTRVHVLDDRRGRLGVIHHELVGGRGVLEVVEPGRPTVHLHCATEASGIWTQPVESSLLVLVLAVFERFGELARDGELAREAVACIPSHVGGDPGVVSRCVRESLGRQASPRGFVERSLVERSEDLRISLRPHHHDHRLVVLGRGANHGRTADVDLLDGSLEGDLFADDGVDERVQIAANEVDLAQPVLGQRFQVLRLVAPGQNARVDARVQRLDPAVHHLGKARQVAHRLDVKRRVLDGLQGASCGEEVVTEALEPAGESGESALVANG